MSRSHSLERHFSEMPYIYIYMYMDMYMDIYCSVSHVRSTRADVCSVGKRICGSVEQEHCCQISVQSTCLTRYSLPVRSYLLRALQTHFSTRSWHLQGNGQIDLILIAPRRPLRSKSDQLFCFLDFDASERPGTPS